MKNKFFLLSIAALSLVVACNNKKTSLEMTEIIINSPFDMPGIKIPDFSNCRKISITDFGAVAGNKEKNTLAIEKAIERANSIGGATVVIPEGEWITGKIHLKSNVNLFLGKGAVLLFSENPDDYLPPVHSTWEGVECYNYSPLIYAYECENIAVTGQGEIKAKMDVWKKWFSRPKGHMESLKRLYYMASYDSLVSDRKMVNDSAHFRPQFIQFNRCKHILLEGISITNSPFWTIHPYLSKDIVIRNITVYAHGHNNDGVDPEMSQNMLIENCIFDQGDDAIAVKSGRNQDAWRLNTPSKNIVIKNCTVKNGHQLLAIGSELSGGVENVFMDSCIVADSAKMFHLLFIKTNERRGGYVNGIYMSNITAGKMDKGVMGIETDVLYQWRNLVPTIEKKLTPIKNVNIENVKAGEVNFVSRIIGQKQLPVENITLKKILTDTIKDKRHIHENILNFREE